MALWYATRAFGLVSMVLLTAVTVLGLLVAARTARGPRMGNPPTAGSRAGDPGAQASRAGNPRTGGSGRRSAGARRASYVVTALHRSLSLLSVVLIALHVATSVIDSYVAIRWVDAVVPFVSAYRPFWVGLGSVALDLMIALVVTSLLRVRLGLRTWRAVHWLAYASWPVALVHGLGIGTDDTLVLALAVGCTTAVAAAALIRATTARKAATVKRAAMAGPAVLAEHATVADHTIMAGHTTAAGHAAMAEHTTMAAHTTTAGHTATAGHAARIKPDAAGMRPDPAQRPASAAAPTYGGPR
ncbi:ferric reductase-like transmembrane domain-containing protein [Actinoallomurus sp. NPDC050550]|uniref:ferric reductase-like transmembrane domain-containing protein n=1 Tax=Actinoallomurus sp. NPDC050550 TaxID=3154937 RepID=UPI0033E5C757